MTEFILYKVMDNENVIGKTMTKVRSFNITIKDNVSVVSPNIRLKESSHDVNGANYCYISSFDRYYFIRDVRTNSPLIELELECDVLESFKEDILNSYGDVKRGLEEDDYPQIVGTLDIRKTVQLAVSSTELGKERSMVLTTIGGELNE